MTDLNWMMALFGLLAGGLMGALYFAGLALGIRLALRGSRPAALLLASAALRIGMLLGGGWLAATVSLETLAGYALGFLLVRMVAVTWARRAKGATPWS